MKSKEVEAADDTIVAEQEGRGEKVDRSEGMMKRGDPS